MIASDNSGSMTWSHSKNSKLMPYEIANLMLCIAHKICQKSVTLMFSDNLKTVNLPKTIPIMSNLQEVNRHNDGGGTYGHLPIQYLLQQNIKVDRIIFISDMQCYSDYSGDTVIQLLTEYKRKINPNVKFYSIDTTGYGSVQVPQQDPNSCLISGWSEKLFEFIPYFEQDKTSILDKINRITLEVERPS